MRGSRSHRQSGWMRAGPATRGGRGCCDVKTSARGRVRERRRRVLETVLYVPAMMTCRDESQAQVARSSTGRRRACSRGEIGGTDEGARWGRTAPPPLPLPPALSTPSS